MTRHRRRSSRAIVGTALVATVALAMIGGAPTSATEATAARYQPTLRVMTYNIRHDPPPASMPERTWASRRSAVVELIKTARPALLAVQEATRIQRQNLVHDTGYAVYPSQGAPELLLWRPGRLTQVMSSTGAPEGGIIRLANPGGCSNTSVNLVWTLLRDNYPAYAGGRSTTYIVATSHFSVDCRAAREAQAQDVVDELSRVRRSQGPLPVIFVGDLNARRPSCVGGSYDEQTLPTLLSTTDPDRAFTLGPALGCTGGLPATVNKRWDRRHGNDDSQIDHVLYTPGRFDGVAAAKVVTTFNYLHSTTSPSDHYPISVTLNRQ